MAVDSGSFPSHRTHVTTQVPSNATTGSGKALSWQEPPGGILVWIIVFLELVTFGAGLGVFLFQAKTLPSEFTLGRDLLNQRLALINTMVLLTGGWCMANSLGFLRINRPQQALFWIRCAIVTGLGFSVIKVTEYAEKISHGVGFGHDDFFTLYFAITGFHLVHVLIATLLLIVMARGIRRGRYDKNSHDDVESCAIFWHMCDLIWLLVYPIVYLL